jgi:hypothetical protein
MKSLKFIIVQRVTTEHEYSLWWPQPYQVSRPIVHYVGYYSVYT